MTVKDPTTLPKRFYKTVHVAPHDRGFAVRLDGRQARTPAQGPLAGPSEPLAGLIADEWAEQGEFIVFADMPATRLAYTAIDRLPGAREAVAEEAVRYVGSDLLCYFAEAPAALIARQTAAWGPVLDWAESELGLRMHRAAGVIHTPQPPETLARARTLVQSLDDFSLAGLAFGAPLFGSFVLAEGVRRGRLSGGEAFDLSRLDETFQEEAWGVDAEAAARAERMRREALMLERWFLAL